MLRKKHVTCRIQDEDIAVPVHVIDCNEQEIGMDGYPVEVDDFERYSKCVKVLTEKILRRARI